MKKIFLYISLILLNMTSATSQAEEVIVNVLNKQNWSFGTGQNAPTPTTAKWFLGFLNGHPNNGTGSLWFYSGDADGWVYADYMGLKNVSLGSLTNLSYNTYTSHTGPGREDVNIAPSINIYLNVPGKPDGSIKLDHSPGVYGAVPRGQWVSRNVLLEKWTSSQVGTNTHKTLNEWLGQYPNATINKIRIQTGATKASNKRVFGGWTMGIDNVVVGHGLQEPRLYNFENYTNQDIIKLSVSPVIITKPEFYVNDGEIVETPEDELEEVKEPVVKPTATTDVVENTATPYTANDGFYMPIMFAGNTTVKQLLSSLANVGNPDETILSDVSITKGGSFLFGGVPFYIPSKNNNCWDSNLFDDDEEHKLNIKVGLENVLEVHTIMNTTYSTGDKETIFLQFEGSKGAIFVKELVINKDIRDLRTSNFSKIVPPTKVVWSRPLNTRPNQGSDWHMMLDSQVVTLPSSFHNQELKSITIVDKGKKNNQRSFLVGVTVKLKTSKLN
jgi:hypothetical protein